VPSVKPRTGTRNAQR